MKTKRSLINILVNSISQIVTLGLGIIIPKLFIMSFGSEVNGVVSSIGQIFVFVGLLEAGIGGVTTQALYKTVVNNDYKSSNEILSAATKYYRKIGIEYIIAVLVLAIVYPLVVQSSVDKYTVSIIILLTGMGGAVNFFLQNKYTVLLNAEGKNYILTTMNMILNLVINIAKILLLLYGFNIIAVQMTQFIVSMIKILITNLYMRKNYKWVDFNEKPNFKALEQHGSQMVHQVSYMIFNNTDILVLTFITKNLLLVSVYTIYSTIIGVLDGVISNINNGVTFAFGQTYAEDKEKYKKYFDAYEVLFMTMVFSCFLVTAYYIIPFLRLYTSGITDINYLDSLLAIMFVVMKLFVSMRSQCYTAILISGNFKETQNSAIIEAFINIVATIISVNFIGIYGVLLGTIIALIYRNIYCIIFANKKVLNRSPLITFKRWGINMIMFCIFLYVFNFIKMPQENYLQLLGGSILMFILVVIVMGIINYIFFRKALDCVFELIKYIFRKRSN